MLEANDLFENNTLSSFDVLLNDIQKFGDQTAARFQFPSNFFKVKKNTPKSGKVNYSLTLNEIPFPFTEENGKDKLIATTIFRIEEKGARAKESDCIVVSVNIGTYDCCHPEKPVEIKEKFDKGNLSGYIITLSLDSPSTLDYFKHIIEYKIANYTPAMPPFGCCDKYLACSDVKQCLHINPFYFRACQYRKNLLNGKVFYGKNSTTIK